jgi:sugar porter (SP) family MFS transporter
MMIVSGILAAFIVNAILASSGDWRLMLGLAAVPSLILLLGMLFMPETPRYLVHAGDEGAAHEVIEDLPGDDHPQERIAEIREVEQEDEEAITGLRGLLAAKWVRPALLVATGLAVFQQLVGINTIIYYAPVVIGYTGFAVSSIAGSLTGAVIVGVVNVLATIVAIVLVDRVGRRPLLMFGTMGCLLTLTATGILFLFNPKQVGIILLIVILLYIVSFAIGLGPTYWLLADEVFPTRLRGIGSSISTVGNWTANLLVSITFLTLINALGKPVTFWIYAAFALVEVLFAYFLVPETKNRPLEDIEDYWENGHSWQNVDHGPVGRSAT